MKMVRTKRLRCFPKEPIQGIKKKLNKGVK